ncbi:MAG: hypothetical protein P0Y53_00185 [Candidatus Pseudobacter hemicellulosilyticus]|uniref:DUF4397 domain-containing protein n=1 Tax=Candidatus Pseudobacter hemicellulosilyticus TaxID=3121375 RepID=A0AAJ6BI51_9BACT|nr:MAG: hypothetical protein P0Y53_00185 [Pseudobacter sp.]
MQHRYYTLLMLLVVQVAFNACKKKVDTEYDNRPNQQPVISSNTRIVNLVGARELQIGEMRLSSFTPPDREGYYGSPGTLRITPYFPENGQIGGTYNIPTEFIGSDGIIRDLQLSSLGGRDYAPAPRPFNLQDYGREPMDYYHVRYRHGVYPDSLFAIPRSVSPSSDPTKFKVRVVNVTSPTDEFSRTGPLTLAWADGTPVDPRTSNIPVTKASDYIELPYGTYQLKLLLSDGRELPAKGSSDINVNILNPYTGTLMGHAGEPGPGNSNDTWLNYAVLKSFQPGGVYSIAAARQGGYGVMQDGSNGESIAAQVNSYSVINDISEPANLTYARVQALNTIPGKQVKWTINNSELGSTAFGAATDYRILVRGTYTLQAADAQGGQLAEATLTLEPGDNISAWMYTGSNGQPAISFSSNNMSAVYSLSVNGNDGSYATRKDGFPFWIRFMNFCPQLPEVTFTSNNGSMIGASASHVQYGQQVVNNPYVRLQPNFGTDLLVYASTPAQLPGDWLPGIAPLTSKAFIADINLYKTPGKPQSESGIYTAVLIGNLNSSGADHARLLLIKHNR